ncbi:Guanylate kinase [Candidatus Promineifilum breve]|uniref:Guanylate kinase n=1 Tax=Candidatus Promineifilum breve TaxID=1806508 RepID=A0A160SYN9_9CHLR|nr:guanylate kinase [Candidatus Promineifilum breve]CUS02436.2 Guanylate kinase [Candidatus Promineifilum breve]
MMIDTLAPNPDQVMDSAYECDDYPLLLILSGPSGVGKDTVARLLIERRPDSFYFVVTATTRPPRDDEVHGINYFFVSFNEFARMIEDDELLEYAIVYNDYKGIPKQQIRDALSSGRDVILRVDVQGAATVRRIIPNAISVFLTTRTEEGLVNRLQQRKQDTSEGIALRTATARQEMKRLEEFDYCVVNPEGQPDVAVERLLSIIDAAHSRVNQQPVRL